VHDCAPGASGIPQDAQFLEGWKVRLEFTAIVVDMGRREIWAMSGTFHHAYVREGDWPHNI
jgi:hypothetical protein